LHLVGYIFKYEDNVSRISTKQSSELLAFTVQYFCPATARNVSLDLRHFAPTDTSAREIRGSRLCECEYYRLIAYVAQPPSSG